MKTLLALLLLIPSLSWSYDKEELVCISAYSIGRDVYEAQGDTESFQLLTQYQNEIFLKYDVGHFPTAHIDARKFLLKQRWDENSNYLPDLINDCIAKQN